MGRPRTFDPEHALDQAMEVFWRNGYEGTSLVDLTVAMGINRPSLYSAFGSKEGLFRQALDRYAEGPAGYVLKALEEPTAREVAERILRGAADRQTDPANPPGCMAVSGALACGPDSEAIRQALISERQATELAIRERLERALAEGDLYAGSDPAELARYVVVLVRGMAVEAAGGASRDELERVVEWGLRAWPD
jgi:AcrR family transcriptional regulator